MSRSGLLHPYVGLDVASLLDFRAGAHPDRPFVYWHPFEGPAGTLTYGDIAARSAAVAGGLAARGVKTGDRMLIHLDNCPEFIVAWFACARRGAVAVTTNTRSAAEEVAYFAGHSEAVAAITQPRYAELVGRLPGLQWTAVTSHDAGVEPGQVVRGRDSFDALHAEPPPPRPVDPAAPLSVQYTSGTTSRPKGVLWSHANALWGGQVSARHEGLHHRDRHFVYLPLFHTNALSYGVLASLWVGASLVLVPKWSTSRFWDISLRYRCSWASLIGPTVRAIRQASPPGDQPYRLFGAGVSDPPLGIAVKTIGWWGMTETISHPIVGDVDLPNERLAIGRPAPEYQVCVARDDGSPVEPDETGHLLVKGVPGISLFMSYLFDDVATANSFDRDGWFRTGDLVTLRPSGHIRFADRAKDMLRVGAENVAASEVERVLAAVPGVVEAAVVGRPDARLDEVPVAFLVVTTEAIGLRQHVEAACASGLADFKRPRDIHIVDDLPRVTLGKVDKKRLREVAQSSEPIAPDRFS